MSRSTDEASERLASIGREMAKLMRDYCSNTYTVPIAANTKGPCDWPRLLTILACALVGASLGGAIGFITRNEEHAERAAFRAYTLKQLNTCIATQVELYGDLIGEDPDQSGRNVAVQMGAGVKGCLEENL